jgi:hypothetical protein
MSAPSNIVPKINAEFYPQDNSGRVLMIKEVGDLIQTGDHIGRAILASDDVWYDCFYSDKNMRFQYFPDSAGHDE